MKRRGGKDTREEEGKIERRRGRETREDEEKIEENRRQGYKRRGRKD